MDHFLHGGQFMWLGKAILIVNVTFFQLSNAIKLKQVKRLQ